MFLARRGAESRLRWQGGSPSALLHSFDSHLNCTLNVGTPSGTLKLG